MQTLGSRIQKGIKIFLALVVITFLILLIFTASKKTLPSLLKMDPLYLAGAFVLWGAYLILDAFRLSLFTHGVTGKWGNMSTSIDIILTGAFLAAVTPFQTGGLPVQLYLLKRDGVPWGKGTLIILLRGVFFAIMLLTLLPFLVPILVERAEISLVKNFMRYSMIIYGIIVILIVFVLSKPQILKRWLLKLTIRKGKRTKATKWVHRIFTEIYEMREGFWNFAVDKKWHTLASIILTYFAYIPYFFIAPLLLRGVGVNISYLKAAFFQLVVVIFTFFSPTPGATGISEGGFAILFSGIIEKHLLGVFTILWRFFIFYLAAIIGGVITLKILGLGEMTFEEEEKEAKKVKPGKLKKRD